MSNVTNEIRIRNFKSIYDVYLKDCRRINLIIGKPNVGKSNILEALATFSLPFARYMNNKSLLQFIRAESETELFFNGNTNNDIEISVGNDTFYLSSSKTSFITRVAGFLNKKSVVEISKLKVSSSTENQPNPSKDIKSYFFHSPFSFENTPVRFLQPGNGCNLFNILNSLTDLKIEISEILNGYGLKLSFDNNSREIKFWKELPSGEVYIVPFNSIADTLQRMIFYKTAIASNQDSIITFEEPEAHAYPPYISKITTDIIYSESNQFFITTHSPYVVNDFMEADRHELAIYLVDYKNGQTIVKRLSDSELDKVYEFGVDLFFNTEMFLS